MLQLSSCKRPPWIQSQLPGVIIKLTCIVLCQGQPNGGESCTVLESRSPHSPVAKLLQLSYTVYELYAASEERCERGYRQVCVELCCQMSWRLTRIKIISATYVSSVDLLSTICARIQHGVQLHGGPQKKNTQNCQNQEVSNFPGQYGILTHTQKYTQKDKQLYMHTDMHTHMHRHTKTHI